jgi:protein SCO1/2
MIMAMTSVCLGQNIQRVGIDEQLGKTLPLAELKFHDEDGEPITLDQLFDRPVVLTLVYFKCPGICTPLLQELVAVAEIARMEPGKDYRLVTISFDATETPKMSLGKTIGWSRSVLTQPKRRRWPKPSRRTC